MIALNRHMADEAKQMFGDQLRRAVRAAECDRYRRDARMAGAPVHEAPPCDAPYIVSVARLDEIQKDHRTLLRAYAQMIERERQVAEDLVIVGNGAFRSELEALAVQLGIARRVHFVGPSEQSACAGRECARAGAELALRRHADGAA